jgi:hypothetical protein
MHLMPHQGETKMKACQQPEYLMLLGVISQMPDDAQIVLKELKQEIKTLIGKTNKELGLLAVALLAVELQDEQ